MGTIAYFLLFFSLFFAPVAFGTADAWAQAILEITLFVALLLGALHGTITRQHLRPLPGRVPLALFLGWIAFQLIPLPISLVGFLSPHTIEIYQPYLALEPGARFLPISVHPLCTMHEFFRYAAFAATYVLTVQLLADKQRLEKAIAFAAVVCLLVCLQGIIQYFTDNTKIYWYRDLVQNELIFGSFAYKNHFAGYAIMLLPLSLGLMLYHRPRSRPHTKLRTLFADFLNHPAISRYFLFSVTVCVLLTAIFLSGSRGGAVCAVLSCFLWYIFSRKRLRISFSLPTLAAFGTVIAIGLGAAGLEAVDQRFGQAVERDLATVNGRVAVWKNSLEMAADFPLTGSGTGTFSSLYPSYMVVVSRPVKFALNTYLETLIDGGVVAALFGFWFLFEVLQSNARNAKKRRNRFALIVYCSSLAGILAFLCHGLIETLLKVALAPGLTFFFLLGLNVASSSLSSRSVEDISSLRRSGPFVFRWGAIVVVFMLLLSSAGFRLKPLLHTEPFAPNSRMRHNMTNQEARILLQDASAAVQRERFNAAYHVAKGFSEDRLGEKLHALQSYKRAMQLNPADAPSLMQIAQFMQKQGESELTEKFYSYAIARHPTFHMPYFFLADWLLAHERIDDALDNFKYAFTLNPGFGRRFIPWLAQKNLSFDQMRRALPDRVAPHLTYARLLDKQGDTEQAGDAYALAITFLDLEDSLRSHYFIEPSRFYMKQHDEETALGILLQGITVLPHDYTLRLVLGDLYKSQTMAHKAVEQYQQALRIKPEGERAKQRLDAL